MEIKCPHCEFSRTVSEDKIPQSAEVATCPKCGKKFRFRNVNEKAPEAASQPAPVAPPRAPSATPRAPAPEAPQRRTPPSMPPDEAYGEEQAPPRRAQERKPSHRGDVFEGLDSIGQADYEQTQYQRSGHQEPPQYGEDVPWERLDIYGFFPGLFQTIKRAMLHPVEFFRNMAVGGGMLRPLIFYVLLSMFGAVLQYIYQMLGMQFMFNSQDAAVPTEVYGIVGAASAGMLLIYPVIFAAFLFVGTAIQHLFLMVFQSASRGFEGTLRVMAYSCAPVVLSIVPMVGSFIALFWTLVIVAIGLKNVHDSSYIRVIAALLSPFLLLLFMGLAAALMIPAMLSQ